MTDKRQNIRIDVPTLARVEGEGALELVITDGKISDLKLRIYEPPRYFEKFLEGRSYHEVPDMVARICPVAYQMSAVQALESICEVNVTPWTESMRRVFYCGEWVQSHSLHLHLLALPDYLGFNNVMEMSAEYPDVVRRGMQIQNIGNELITLLGGRSVHPVGVVVGGFSSAPARDKVSALVDKLNEIIPEAHEMVRWLATLDIPEITDDFISVALSHKEGYAINEGRLISDQGLDLDKADFTDYFSESHVAYSTALHCHLEGQPYLVGPLARLNLNHAQLPDDIQKLIADIGIEFPSQNMFHSMLARALEVCYVLGEARHILNDYVIPDHTCVPITVRAGIGYGCTEAPRGLLWHRYELDAAGCIVSARLVPPTSQNQARIEADIQQTLEAYGLDHTHDELKLMSEKVIRNYDPCISCATHFLKLSVKHRASMTSDDKAQFLSSAPLAIIGVGSMHGADALGYQVVTRLMDDAAGFPESVPLRYMDHFDMTLHEQLNGVEQIVFIDALDMGGERGQLQSLSGNEVSQYHPHLSSHSMGLSDYVLWLRTVMNKVPMMRIIGLDIGGDARLVFEPSDIDGLIKLIYDQYM